MQDYAQAAAPKKHLSEFTAQDVEDSIKGDGPNVSGNRLWSENLNHAHSDVKALGNADLTESFEDLARTVLSGDYQKKGGSGFQIRDAVGLATSRMLHDGDTATFDRLLPEIAHDKTLAAQVKALKAELKGEVIAKGLTVHSSLEVASPAGPAQRR